MLKAIALESFWSLGFPRSKKQVSVSFWVAACLVALNLLMLMSYVYSVNEFASGGYEIKSLQKQLSVLNEENKKLSLKISEAGSMVAIQTGFLNANFVQAGTSQFVDINSNQFTQR